jgi:acyl-CoA reductase-like NAD-dependent aldehyde dehydrogenase
MTTQDTAADTFEVRSPADGRVVCRLPVDDAGRVRRAAAELRAAQPEWEDLGPAARARHLLAWLDWFMDHERHLLQLVQQESGKSWGDTQMETVIAVQVVGYVAAHAPRWLADRELRPSGPLNATRRLRLHTRPHPLVGVITPWNFPLGMPMLDVPFALAAGAAVLSKPSEVTPLAWAEAVRGWAETGAPAVLGCVTGPGVTGTAVVDEVDMIQFTGSTRTGRAVAVRAAERLIPCSLELGGKDAMIVLDDADLERAVNGALWGGMFNSGQVRTSVERVYVHAAVYDAFVERLAARVGELRQGTDADGSFSVDVGAMANQAQVDIVARHVDDAVAKGARILAGGKPRGPGAYFPPTVLVDVDHSMACMREETFGPTLPVMKVGDEDEAVRLANDSAYGLAGSVWTTNPARAERIARRMETGAVCANNTMVNVLQAPLPMGGWKESGLGTRMGGEAGIRKYCRQQAYVAERVALSREPNWYPYRARRQGALARAVRLFGMHDWRRRLGSGSGSRTPPAAA